MVDMKYLLVVFKDLDLNINIGFISLKELDEYVVEHDIKRYAIYKLLRGVDNEKL